MKPNSSAVIPAALDLFTAHTQSETGPDRFAQLCYLLGIFRILGRDRDNAGAGRGEEIKAVSELLERGAAIAPAALSQSLRETVKKTPNRPGVDLRISALNATLDDLRDRLIELHSWVEEEFTAVAQALCKDIWSFLDSRSKRRNVPGCFWF